MLLKYVKYTPTSGSLHVLSRKEFDLTLLPPLGISTNASHPWTPYKKGQLQAFPVPHPALLSFIALITFLNTPFNIFI